MVKTAFGFFLRIFLGCFGVGLGGFTKWGGWRDLEYVKMSGRLKK